MLSKEMKARVLSANEERVRVGKTAKDRASGAASRNEANKAARREWRNESRGQQKLVPFPAHTLGGKGNSSKAFKMCGGKGRTQNY